MKKPYLSPSTLVIAITQRSYILTGSPGILTSQGPASGSCEVLSRRSGSIWDDDDEDY